jgi:carbonic anhydrase/acetyltransferase-like protein (isoleucine patch superfamily)
MAIRSFEDNHPEIANDVRVDSTAVVIGDVVIATQSSIWPQAVIRGDVQSIRIGARTNIQDGAIVHVTHDGEFSPGGFATTIGDDVTVGHRAIIHACTIGSRVLVGMGAIVMDGAVVEDDVIIGAGALVTSGMRLESGWLYTGSPAKPVRELKPGERRFLPYSAAHYTKLAGRHG